DRVECGVLYEVAADLHRKCRACDRWRRLAVGQGTAGRVDEAGDGVAQRDIRLRVEHRELTLQLLGKPAVVGVQEGDQRPTRSRQPAVARGRTLEMRPWEIVDAAVRGMALDDRPGVVRRAPLA